MTLKGTATSLERGEAVDRNATFSDWVVIYARDVAEPYDRP
jgi:hypothetical protein